MQKNDTASKTVHAKPFHDAAGNLNPGLEHGPFYCCGRFPLEPNPYRTCFRLRPASLPDPSSCHQRRQDNRMCLLSGEPNMYVCISLETTLFATNKTAHFRHHRVTYAKWGFVCPVGSRLERADTTTYHSCLRHGLPHTSTATYLRIYRRLYTHHRSIPCGAKDAHPTRFSSGE